MTTTAFVNGFEKCGLHAVQKACRLLGVPTNLDHVRYGGELPEAAKYLFIKRDPRNALCSLIRFEGHPLTSGMFLTRFREFRDIEGSFAEYTARFTGWLSDPQFLQLRYEDLLTDDAMVRRIAEHLGMPYLDEAFTLLPGMTVTWRVPHSDYRTIWTPAVDAAWKAEGGDTILSAWGYV